MRTKMRLNSEERAAAQIMLSRIPASKFQPVIQSVRQVPHTALYEVTAQISPRIGTVGAITRKGLVDKAVCTRRMQREVRRHA